MSLFKGTTETPDARGADYAHVANVLVANAQALIGEGGELLETGEDEEAVEALAQGLESLHSLRAIFKDAGIEAPRLYAALDQLEIEARSLRRSARERLADGADEEE